MSITNLCANDIGCGHHLRSHEQGRWCIVIGCQCREFVTSPEDQAELDRLDLLNRKEDA